MGGTSITLSGGRDMTFTEELVSILLDYEKAPDHAIHCDDINFKKKDLGYNMDLLVSAKILDRRGYIFSLSPLGEEIILELKKK